MVTSEQVVDQVTADEVTADEAEIDVGQVVKDADAIRRFFDASNSSMMGGWT